MTDPALKVDPHETLYVTDAELIRRMGVPEKVMRPVLRHFDDKPQLGFPKKQALFGNRRYWPAVKAYLDRHSGLRLDAQPEKERVNAR
jgi:hypothetical protein